MRGSANSHSSEAGSLRSSSAKPSPNSGPKSKAGGPRPGRSGPSSSPAASSPNGSQDPSFPPFGKYNLLREIGRGAMGVVYEAEDTELRRRVALKLLIVPP